MKRRLKEKKAPAKSPFQVLTTDQEELEFRRQRGSSEKLSIQFLDHPSFPFVTYHVSSQTGCSYSVEIRSLSDTINSCSCPDFCVNTLNTCKHIEGVLNYLKRSEKKNSPLICNRALLMSKSIWIQIPLPKYLSLGLTTLCSLS